VVAPEVLVAGGHFISTWQDARLFAGPAGALAYFWRRSVLMTIAVGMAVYMPLHLGLGW
jgi:branched-subunit amino acid transport protein